MLLKSKSKTLGTMLTIAELLYNEAEAFGVLSINRGLPESRLQAYAEMRLSFTKFFLEVLEQHAGLQFNDRIPFIYNTNLAYWDEHLPIAGYSDELHELKPSTVLTSLMMNWNLEVTKHSSASRLLTAALWIIEKHDLKTALEYLFDLLKAGYIIQSDSLSRVIIILLVTRTTVSSDHEVVMRLLGNKSVTAPREWKGVEFTLDWLESVDKIISDQRHLSLLTSNVLQEIEEVRDSNNWDSWLLGQSYIGGLISTVLNVFHETVPTPSLALKAVLSQFEEIRADVPSRVFLIWKDYHPYTSLFLAVVVAMMYKSKIGDGWEDRLFHERLLVPRKIRSQLLSSTDETLPSEWSFLSWKLVHPFSMVFLPGSRELALRSRYFDVNSLIANAEIAAFFKAHNIGDKDTQKIILEREYLGKIPKALFNGSQPLPSYPEAELVKLISKVHFELCLQELQKGQESAFAFLAAKDYRAEIIGLNELLQLYPWSAVVYHELAIACDENGDHASALEYIIPAVVLDFTHPERWRSLAVILNHLGQHEDAKIASVMKEMMLERSNKA